MTTITFNEVPQSLMELNRKVDILLAKYEKEPEADQLMPVLEFQNYMEEKTGRRPARQTVYDNVLKRKVPFEKYGKYLYFRKSVIDSWLSNGRQMT